MGRGIGMKYNGTTVIHKGLGSLDGAIEQLKLINGLLLYFGLNFIRAILYIINSGLLITRHTVGIVCTLKRPKQCLSVLGRHGMAASHRLDQLSNTNSS